MQPAFAEGKPAVYVTTDVWLNLPKTWLQPAYVQTQDWGAEPTRVPGAPILIDVESESTFYSPFWNIEYAVSGRDRIRTGTTRRAPCWTPGHGSPSSRGAP